MRLSIRNQLAGTVSAIDPGAVDRSRASIKPAIPEAGAHGIPLRDEIELELWVGGEPGPASPSPSVADELLGPSPLVDVADPDPGRRVR